VIRRLAIHGLVVIDRAELDPAPGLTAITGETGAGKTVIAQALSMLVGAPADAKAVRPGARHALVEATLGLPSGFWESADDDGLLTTAQDLVEDPSEAVVAVRVPAEGRARALIDGQTTTRAAAAAITGRIVRFSSQHEGRKLVAGATQLAILDAYAGADAQALVQELAGLRRRLRGLQGALDEARARRQAAERERASLEDLVAAVDAAGLSVEEETQLRQDRERLLHADRLVQAASTAADALAPDSADGAVDRIGGAIHAVDAVREIDPQLAEAATALLALQANAQDVASMLRGYLADLDAEPGQLDHIEERLTTYDRLSRRYGPGTAEVLQAAEAARTALAELEEGEGADAEIEREYSVVAEQARDVAQRLSAMRHEAAPRLEAAVVAELAELAMGAAEVRIELTDDGGDPPVQRATLWLRPNPGLPEAPLADVASGGELSRVLLALHGVAAQAEPDTTWIFDEVDAGVGGVTATAVASKLQALARDRQVIVITHLPQVAAVAERHYRLVKGVDDAGRATTTIEAVEGEGLIDELCRMLGSAPTDAGARRHAQELLERRQVPTPKKSRRR
jgi:DNA repair protein RecN (Recombination protein N)